MQKYGSEILLSASDLVNFIECDHLTTLDLINLETPLPRAEDGEDAKLIQGKGYAHEAKYLTTLRSHHARVIDIAQEAKTLEQRIEATRQGMASGADIIFQATLRSGVLVGHADFLRKVARPSSLGDFSYEVMDTKLALSTKAKFIIQLGFYSKLLGQAQGVSPLQMHVVLGDQTEQSFRCADYAKYLDFVMDRLHTRIAGERLETYPDPCDKCDQCRWREICADRRLKDDHLCHVANISKIQIKKLNAGGISTLEQLASAPTNMVVPKMAIETLARLRQQAQLQFKARQTGQNHLELLPMIPGAIRGFSRMPRPDAGDLFFDMEGDPLEEGGLEYLFGLYLFQEGQPEFKAFWAHSRAEEKLAFEQFMDFVTGWLLTYPETHIYHYAHYEETALKKLMSVHGTREAEVDNLLRRGKLVDLYKVVRESIRVSEPKYSIKNIEHFYLEGRTSEVKTASASIVYYERWKETRDQQLLRDIEAYNYEDVVSTHQLREWLLSFRPNGAPWLNDLRPGAEDDGGAGPMNEWELRLAQYREKLCGGLPEDKTTWTPEHELRELTYFLLDFYRRSEKPIWWGIFSRMEMSDEDLLEDPECLAGMTLDPAVPPQDEKRSVIYCYQYPEQESKRKDGDSATVAGTGEPIGVIDIDPDARHVFIKRSKKKSPLPDRLSIGPGQPIDSKVLREAVFCFADSVIAGTHRFPAVEHFLMRRQPKVKGITRGKNLLTDDDQSVEEISHVIERLDGSYTFVQGPPGAGKTYTGSHVIVDLLKQGRRIGVASNSHKAINNLLYAIEGVAEKADVTFRGVKKSTANKPDSLIGGKVIRDVFNADDIDDDDRLVAGTAWLFARDDMTASFDYLFIDEAGQVSLANLVAMGLCAKNIVLLGDQMQLGQPIQGVHPGRSGESTLDFLLDGVATIPPDRGIFLAKTWRMHPDVCRFISDAVYDGRLLPERDNEKQTLLLNGRHHPSIRPTGVQYVLIEHDGCSQRSTEEADLIRILVEDLLQQRFRDKAGCEHQITLENILVVAPYNMQVNLLKQALPDGARVGTVDKFQGQEAEVVIVSMTTSNGDYLPRFIEFLYSKNRLNVAISRAKCLAIFIANPELMAIKCSRPEEMALVNTLCWISEHREGVG